MDFFPPSSFDLELKVVNTKVTPTPLCSVVWDNKLRDVEFLLKTGHDVNEKLSNGLTALFGAIECGHDNMVALLLHRGAEVNIHDDKGFTPLHCATFFRNPTIVKLLLNKKANVHARYMYMTPILIAIISPKPLGIDLFAVISTLIEHGANVNDKGHDGITALYCAVQSNNTRLVNLLITAKANVNVCVHQIPILTHAVVLQLVEVIKALMKVKDLDMDLRDSTGNTALHIACVIGNLDIVKVLVEKDFDVNARNLELLTPLRLALIKQQYQVAEYLLLDERIDVNLPAGGDNDVFLIHTALLFADFTAPADPLKLKVIKAIIDKTDNINEGKGETGTPLHVAVKANEFELTNYLIMKGADVNAQLNVEHCSKLQLSALHIACEPQTDVKIVKLLLSHGAKVNNSANVCINQPLAIAIKTGDFEKVRELQDHGAEVDKKYLDQNISAASKSYSGTEIIERKKISDLLKLNLEFLKNAQLNKYEEVRKNIEDGASVNVSSARCGSALIYASWKGFEEIVDLLLERGADVNFKSATGYTSLHMVCRFHTNHTIAYKLLQHGAHYNLRDDKKQKTPRKHAQVGNMNSLDFVFKYVDINFEDVRKENPTIIPRLLDLKSFDREYFELLKIVTNVKGENLVSLAKSRKSDFLRELDNILSFDSDKQNLK